MFFPDWKYIKKKIMGASGDSAKYLNGAGEFATPEGGGIPPVNIVYEAFISAINGSELIKEQVYRLTDFQTDYTIPYTSDQFADLYGVTEVLLITATSPNTYNSIVVSETFPQDIIIYDHNNDYGSTKGVIKFREDLTKGIKGGFDWRVAKYRRWEDQVPTLIPQEDYSEGIFWTDTYYNPFTDLDIVIDAGFSSPNQYRWSGDGGDTWTGYADIVQNATINIHHVVFTWLQDPSYYNNEYLFTFSYVGNGNFICVRDNGGAYEDYLTFNYDRSAIIDMTNCNLNSNNVFFGDIRGVYFNRTRNNTFLGGVDDFTDLDDSSDNIFRSRISKVRMYWTQSNDFRKRIESVNFGYCAYNIFNGVIDDSILAYGFVHNVVNGRIRKSNIGVSCSYNIISNIESSKIGNNFQYNDVQDIRFSNLGDNFQNVTSECEILRSAIGNNFGYDGPIVIENLFEDNIILCPNGGANLIIKTMKEVKHLGDYIRDCANLDIRRSTIIGRMENINMGDSASIISSSFDFPGGMAGITMADGTHINGVRYSGSYLHLIQLNADLSYCRLTTDISDPDLPDNTVVVDYDVDHFNGDITYLHGITGPLSYAESFFLTGHNHDGVNSGIVKTTKIQLVSPNGVVFHVSIDDSGRLITEEVI